ncbi:MAG: hypothetical protein JXQ82_09230 [Methanomicrobiaceae archaeon]|nr:hypothetical protein [Methanomicrobiaceae archaeon]
MKRILFFERLSVFWIIYALCFSRKYDGAVCAEVTPLAAKIRELFPSDFCQNLNFSDFEESYFEAEEEGYNYGVDALYEKYAENSYFKFIFKLNADPLLECAIKKELFNRYLWKRIRAFTLLKYLAKDCTVFLIPKEGEDPSSFLSPEFLAECHFHVPQISTDFYRIISVISRYFWHLCFVFAIIPVGMLFLRNGLMKQKKQSHFQFALDTYNTGINRQKGYHEFFLYDQDQFHPSRILHVVRNRLEDSKHGHQTRAFFKRYGIHYAEINRLPVSLNFFIRRIIGDFGINGFISFIKGIFNRNNRAFCVIPALAVARTILLTEVLYETFKIDVYIARDEYAPNHVVRTAVAHKYDGSTIGFSHGDCSIRARSWNYICVDKFLLWGDFYKNLLQKSFMYTPTEIIGAGIYGLDKTYQWALEEKIPVRYQKIVGKYKIVLVCGSSFYPEEYITQELTLLFYKDAINLLSSYTDVFVIIKPKGSEFQDIPEFQHLIDENARIIVDNDSWTYRLIPIVDLVICINATSVGIEALMAEKKVLYYDVTENHDYHPYVRYDERLVSYDKETLGKNIELVLDRGLYVEKDVIDLICRTHGYQFDGCVTERFKKECCALAEKCK